jgi:hypothetical protein
MLLLMLLLLLLQDVGLVPIVEPDVSMAGTHTLEAALAINTKIQSVLYRALLEHGVFMEGVILKSNIVNPGRQCPVPYRCGVAGVINSDAELCFWLHIVSSCATIGANSRDPVTYYAQELSNQVHCAFCLRACGVDASAPATMDLIRRELTHIMPSFPACCVRAVWTRLRRPTWTCSGA